MWLSHCLRVVVGNFYADIMVTRNNELTDNMPILYLRAVIKSALKETFPSARFNISGWLDGTEKGWIRLSAADLVMLRMKIEG